ncbi:MAG: hypothetical protein NTW96_25170 [Planctomycetia bacterium]|nr:hypothetical protein [Planctomycetia bacterium]
MAGRPKTATRNVGALEERAYGLFVDLVKLRPKQYAARRHDDEDLQGELCSCWNRAVEAVEEAWECLQELLEGLERRAGLPYQLLYLQRERSRGLLKGPLAQPVEKSAGSEGEFVESGGDG